MKILLVDDEPLMRVALTSLMDYEAHGFEICGTAANGLEALQIIEQEHPEIIITDLKMPVMDGLELIREIQSRSLLCKILVISNYSDYELVREALKLGAVDYLLKISIQEDELLKQLKNLRTLIEQDQAYAAQAVQQRNHLTQQQKKAILRDFFSGNDSDISPFADRSALSLHFMDTPCNLFYIISGSSDPDSQSWIDFSTLEKVLEETLSHAGLTMEMFTLFPTGMAMLTSVADVYLSEFAWHLQDILQTYISVPCTVIYTNSFCGYREAKAKFELCKNASNLLFYGTQTVIHGEDIRLLPEFTEQPAVLFASHLTKQGAVEGIQSARQMITQMLDQFRGIRLHPTVVRRFFYRVFEYIYISTQDNSENTEARTQIKHTLEKIGGSPSLSALQKSVFDLLPCLFPSSGVRREVLAILDYIDKNFDQKLSLDDVADHVFLNKSYICRIFKEDMNTSIVNYINTVRMKQAARLIESGTIPVKNICYSVGIETPSYFHRLFKAHFGVSPVQYANGERKEV